MEEAKSCPMAFFTPIVEIAEAPLEIKEEEIKIEIKSEDICDVAIDTKEEVSDSSKKRRGRPKKVVDNGEGKKPKRKYTRKPKEEIQKREKRPRKQKSPKKNQLIDEISFDEEDLLITSEHLDIKTTIKCPICKDNKEFQLKEIKEHYKQNHPGKRLRTSRFFGDTHQCDICTKEFKSPTSLKDHIETHNNYYYCDICNHSTKKILEHIVHLRAHSAIGLFQCLMCDFTSLEINEITHHVNNHEDLLKYWCDSCKKSFNILQHFQEHDNYHTGLKPFDCEFCGKCFLYSRYLHAHKVNLHREEVNCPTTYLCVICNKVYQHRNSLKLHMNSHTGNYAVCDVCGKTLSSKEKLKFHLRTHTGYKPYSCQFCSKSFTKKPILVEHVRVHTGEKPYVCDFCAKGFSQRSSLVIHMRGHTGEKPYVCQFCTKGFVAKAMLNIHLKSCKGLFHVAKMELEIESENEEPSPTLLNCPKCDFVFLEPSHLNCHLKSHTENPIVTYEGRFKCDICPASYKWKHSLKRHTEIEHSNTPRFQCDFCYLTFACQRNLTVHRNLHTKQVMFNCTMCNKQFLFRSTMESHLRSHSESAFKCSMCGASFKTNPGLMRHRKIHLDKKNESPNDGEYQCDLCDAKFKWRGNLIYHKGMHSRMQ